MNKTITFIKRKVQPKYHSIEALFDAIILGISNTCPTKVYYAKCSGASPRVLLRNLWNFEAKKTGVFHITGDVHYMALVTGKQTVLTIHDVGSALKGSMLKKIYIKLFWFWLPAMIVRRITVISKFTKEELNAIIPFARHKIRVVHNPVSSFFKPKPYRFNGKMPTILCMGTKANKNLERIINSVKEVRCKLYIIGSLSVGQKAILEKNNILYINVFNISTEAIVAAYQNCDLLCFPSTYEGFGMPIIEAQAIGRPVITSNIGAMKEVAGDSSACLVDPLNEQSIKNAVLKVIDDDTYREKLVKEGFKNIERFSLEAIAKQYVEIYKEL